MISGKWYIIYITLLAVAVGGFVGTGCKKIDGINNNNVIRTPYGVYFADKLGALYNTNDGRAYKLIIPADGVVDRALLTSGTNVMYVKFGQNVNPNNGTVGLSANNGLNWNPVNSTTLKDITWPNQIINVPGDNVYLASTHGSSVQYSPDNGLTWNDDVFVLGTPSGFAIQSFTLLSNGQLYGLDYTNSRLFVKNGPNQKWSEVTGVVFPLPPGQWQLAHINTTLVAADLTGAGGIWYSTDFGINWSQYAGLPAGRKIFIASGPFDKTLLAGVESEGIYRLDATNTFQPSVNGLLTNTSVYGITAKEDNYKNGIIKQYIYIAANTGLYRSEDLGQNWVLMRAGDFHTIY